MSNNKETKVFFRVDKRNDEKWGESLPQHSDKFFNWLENKQLKEELYYIELKKQKL
jgi:hypothetical protein